MEVDIELMEIWPDGVMVDKEELARRKARAERFKKKDDKEYGFLSRGEDNRLLEDESRRKEYFKTIQLSVRAKWIYEAAHS